MKHVYMLEFFGVCHRKIVPMLEKAGDFLSAGGKLRYQIGVFKRTNVISNVSKKRKVKSKFLNIII